MNGTSKLHLLIYATRRTRLTAIAERTRDAFVNRILATTKLQTSRLKGLQSTFKYIQGHRRSCMIQVDSLHRILLLVSDLLLQHHCLAPFPR